MVFHVVRKEEMKVASFNKELLKCQKAEPLKEEFGQVIENVIGRWFQILELESIFEILMRAKRDSLT
jgi:hypothetical protein